MGPCHFRRFADRAAADRRPGQYRSGTPIGTSPRVLAHTLARAIFPDSRGTLAEQTDRRGPVEVRVPRLKPTRSHGAELPAATGVPRRDLILFNGLGGITT